MATTFTSNYYPPIVDTYIPAFICDANNTFLVRVYFSLSPYTDFNHSQYMHIKVVDQQTNKSVLIYNSGLKLDSKVLIDKNRTTDDKYYIELTNKDFKTFSPYRYYKVQLRSTDKPQNSNNASSLYRQNSIYSEWSTVCLIRGIRTPELKIKYFQNDPNLGTGVLFKSNTIIVRGELAFSGETDYSKVPENIKSYRVKFYDSDNHLLDDSGDLFPPVTNLRSISYDAKYTFSSEMTSYKMVITVLTTGLYEHTESFRFSISNEHGQQTLVNGFMYPDIENGTVNIQINTTTDNHKEVLLYIRRTSSESNFKLWEDIYSIQIPAVEDVPPNSTSAWGMTWRDCTVESGVWYQYGFQTVTFPSDLRTNNEILKRKNPYGYYIDVGEGNGEYSLLQDGTYIYQEGGRYSWKTNNETVFPYTANPIVGGDILILPENDTEDKIIMIFEDSFLVGKDGQQLKITYDNTLDSLKYTQYISKTDTIGSKYPFIRQNATTCYKTFPISGLITFLQDENELFISKDDLFINNQIRALYDEYNNRENITKYNDYIRERKFREKVMEFLIKDDVKLYRSTTEGNILIKLMDVSFAPKTELGRYLYSFSATAVECEECNIDNYSKYNIQKRAAESYDLITHFTIPKYKTEITKIIASVSSTQLLNALITQDNGIKDTLLNSDWDNNIAGVIHYEDGSSVPIANIQEALVGKDYSLEEINPYHLEFEFLNRDVGDSWSFTVQTEEGENLNYEISTLTTPAIQIFDSGNEPFTFNDIVFNQDTELNINCNAQLVYEYVTRYVRDGNDWIEVTDESDNPEVTVINGVSYTINTLEAINSGYVNNEWFYIDQNPVQRKDLIDIARTKWSEELDTEQAISFDVYQIQIQDFPQGLVARATYTNDEVAKTFVIGRTYSLDLNLDDDTSDSLTTFRNFYFIGQLISDTSLSPLHFDDSRIKTENNQTYWEEAGKIYPISFYNDLNFQTPVDRAVAIYGIIEGYMDISQFSSSQILFFGRAGVLEQGG